MHYFLFGRFVCMGCGLRSSMPILSAICSLFLYVRLLYTLHILHAHRHRQTLVRFWVLSLSFRELQNGASRCFRAMDRASWAFGGMCWLWSILVLHSCRACFAARPDNRNIQRACVPQFFSDSSASWGVTCSADELHYPIAKCQCQTLKIDYRDMRIIRSPAIVPAAVELFSVDAHYSCSLLQRRNVPPRGGVDDSVFSGYKH